MTAFMIQQYASIGQKRKEMETAPRDYSSVSQHTTLSSSRGRTERDHVHTTTQKTRRMSRIQIFLLKTTAAPTHHRSGDRATSSIIPRTLRAHGAYYDIISYTHAPHIYIAHDDHATKVLIATRILSILIRAHGAFYAHAASTLYTGAY